MIRRLKKFAELSARDRLVLIEAAATLLAFRLAIWLLPTRLLLRSGTGLPACRPSPRSTIYDPRSSRLAWAIQAVSPAIPKSTCLVRALAARRLLARRGISAILRIGVAKTPEFQAHAWLECDGCVLVGGETQTYTRLPIGLLPSSNQ